MSSLRHSFTNIDGSQLEGGGQILRNGVSLSSLLDKPVAIDKIRFNRKPPGLKNQHRTGLQLAAQISSGTLIGAKNSSSSIEYTPGRISLPGYFTADCVTAGSVTLLLQVALPLILFSPQSVSEVSSSVEGVDGQTVGPAPSTLRLFGGTNAGLAPQTDYTAHVFSPFFQKHFLPSRSPTEGPSLRDPSVSLDLKRRGYYPKGGGEVLVSVYPLLQGEKLRPISLLNKGKIKAIKGTAHYAKLPSHIGRDMKYGAEYALEEAGYQIRRDAQPEDGEGVLVDILDDRESNDIAIAGGSGIVLWAELEGGGIIGGSAVGRKGLNAKGVGAEAAKELLRGLERGGCVDEWLQDQIVIFMVLADGRSEVNCGKGELELHTRTAIWLSEQMSDAKFEVDVDEVGNTILRCTGIGYTASVANPSRAA